MSEKYLDSTCSAKERAKDLLSKMSLEEKMAQTVGLFMPAKLEGKIKEACRHGIGSVSTLEVRMMTDLEQISEAQQALQRYIMEGSEHHIPAIFHMEGLCGAFIQGATSFPSGIGRASSFDPELEKQIGDIVGRQERALGFTHTFAPVLDINRDSRLGRQGETYGEDPTLAAAMGAAYTSGIQEGETKGVHSEAVAKHFLGFHNSEAGIHGATSNTPARLLTEIYGKPFQAAITKANLRGVMPCYCTIDGEAASVSKRLLTDLLRDTMGFDGVVASDYSGVANVHKVQRMYESLAETGYRAMEAGMDMELPNKECYNGELMEWFREGKLPMEVLDTAVLRILEAKFRMGLFERPYALAGEGLKQEFYQEKDKEISLRSAEESVILLKNDGVLPMKKNLKKVVVIGPHANNPRSFFGGYTHLSMAEAVKAVANSLAGIGEKANNETKEVPYIPGTKIQSDETEEFDALLRQIKPGCKSLYAELKERLADTEVIYAYGYPVAGNDTSHFAEALEALKGADLCIMTLGGKHGSCSVASMGEGVDATNINLPECQDGFLLQAAGTGVPLIGVHFNGRPISSDVADQHLNAIVEAWNPSEMGAEALVNILTGKVSPSGKLPVSVAYHAGQVPVYYNHPNGSAWHQGESIGFANYVDLPHTPRYFFGHGLSYTDFAYSEMKLSTKKLQPEGEVEISFSLKNTGSMEGTEVVQLYIRDCYASMVRPCIELAGFRRVTLAAGEEKEVSFCLRASQLAFLDVDYRWKIEAGEIEVMIGASSADIRLKDTMQITKSQFIEGKTRAFWA
ncbi:MAG TPA: beta-glucosidase [Clostridiales bacterium]|nr:beta-glucosidase [Clostridiales bacterium]